jgi:uncharacterized protein
MRGLDFLGKHAVEFNTLTVVHHANMGHPLDAYRFFWRDTWSGFIQFIPIMERKPDAASYVYVTTHPAWVAVSIRPPIS